jgi:hypothetical protein
MYKQLVTPNLDPYIYDGGTPISDWLGWCLGYVRAAFDAPPAGYMATDGWNMTQFKHTDRDLPSGVYVPVWFSHWGTYNGVYANWGHVVIYKDGHIWSSPITHKPYADEWGSIEEVERMYRCSFVGWSEDISGMRVVTKEDTVAIIENADNWRWRFNRLHHQLVRNGDMPDPVFQSIVGSDAWTVVESWSDHPEADSLIHWQELGELAEKDDWQGQIYDLQARTAELGKSVTIKDDEIKKLTAQLAVQSGDTQLLNGFGAWLTKIIVRLGLKG